MSRAGGIPDLETAVVATVLSIREGDVMTYGEVAEVAGFPGRARAVGRILASTGEDIPWWRVVGAGMRIVAPAADEQRRRLVAEGHRMTADRIVMSNRLD